MATDLVGDCVTRKAKEREESVKDWRSSRESLDPQLLAHDTTLSPLLSRLTNDRSDSSRSYAEKERGKQTRLGLGFVVSDDEGLVG